MRRGEERDGESRGRTRRRRWEKTLLCTSCALTLKFAHRSSLPCSCLPRFLPPPSRSAHHKPNSSTAHRSQHSRHHIHTHTHTHTLNRGHQHTLTPIIMDQPSSLPTAPAPSHAGSAASPHTLQSAITVLCGKVYCDHGSHELKFNADAVRLHLKTCFGFDAKHSDIVDHLRKGARDSLVVTDGAILHCKKCRELISGKAENIRKHTQACFGFALARG